MTQSTTDNSAPRGVVPAWLARQICIMWLTCPPYSLAKIARLHREAAFNKTPGLVRFKATSKDDLKLDVGFIPGRPISDGVARLPVVLVHGIFQIKESNIWLVKHLVNAGHDVLALDLRAHGKSQGAATTFGVKEKFDIACAIDAAQSRGLINGRVLSMGVSLGAGSALQHAAIDHRVAAVCAVAPFCDLTTAVMTYRAKYFSFVSQPLALESFAYACRQVGFEMGQASAKEAALKLSIPVHYFIGEADNNLSQKMHTEPLFEATHERRRELTVIPRANHFDILSGKFEVFNSAVTAFCLSASQRV